MEFLKGLFCVVALMCILSLIINVVTLIWNFDVYHIKLTITSFVLAIVFSGLANAMIEDDKL